MTTSNDSISVFQCAYNKLRVAINDEDAKSWQQSTLQDVSEAIWEIQTSHGQEKLIRNFGRLRPFLDGLDRYSKVVEVYCSSTQLSFLWAPVIVILQLASSHPAFLDKILHSYELIGKALSLFEIFHENTSLPPCLGLIYADILELHGTAYSILHRRAFLPLFDALFESRFAIILKRFKERRYVLEVETRVAMTHETPSQQVVAWFSADDLVQDCRLIEKQTQKPPELTDWVKSRRELVVWEADDDTEPILWLHGSKAGKTVICSHLIGNLQQRRGITPCWYIIKSSDNSDELIHRILKTIATQLLRSHPELIPFVHQCYASKTVLSSKPSIVELRALLTKPTLGRLCIRIVIDGLDSSSEENQKSILNQFSKICESNKGWKVLFSGRHKPLIARILAGRPQIRLAVNRANNSEPSEIGTTSSRDSGYESMTSKRLVFDCNDRTDLGQSVKPYNDDLRNPALPPSMEMKGRAVEQSAMAIDGPQKWDWPSHAPKMIKLYNLGKTIPNIQRTIQCEGFKPSISDVYNRFEREGYPTDRVRRAKFLYAIQGPGYYTGDEDTQDVDSEHSSSPLDHMWEDSVWQSDRGKYRRNECQPPVVRRLEPSQTSGLLGVNMSIDIKTDSTPSERLTETDFSRPIMLPEAPSKPLGIFGRLKNGISRLVRPPIQAGSHRVEWICDCGDALYIDVNSSSAQTIGMIEIPLRNLAITSHPSPGKVPDDLPSSPTGAHLSYERYPNQLGTAISGFRVNNSSTSTTLESASGASSKASVPSSNPVFLELCVNAGQYLKSLGEIDLSNIRTDGDFFSVVKEHYLLLRSFRSKFWLLKPSTISYVRFSVEDRSRVGILQKPFALPPKTEVDAKRYIYNPCPLENELPISSDLFLHYLLTCTSPSSRLVWLPRIPRKLSTSIFSCPEPAGFGWGIHIDEGPDYLKIFLINLGILTLSGLAALVWRLLENDFQGGFGFACWIIAVLNTLMAVFVAKWRQE